ncbi:LysM peptidoglycan-binding domain-containing protein [Methylophaga lonarensis]|uniref:lytic transglycosylase n=1 Tax=Methylophaga lonarensis TaxID=999151 RepID=UPI003D26F9D5
MLNLKKLFTPLFVVLFTLVSGCSTTSKQGDDARKLSTESSSPPATQYHDIVKSPIKQAESAKVAKKRPARPEDPESELVFEDLWDRIRDGFAMSDHEDMHEVTVERLEWFANHPDFMNRIAERATPYLHYIVEQIEARGLPMELALLPVIESSYEPFAVSSSQAAGIWQFIPGTGRVFGLDQTWWYDGRRDIIASTDAALSYLEKLYNDFNDWELALAAYNAGEGTVGRSIRRNEESGLPTDFWSLELPNETQNYVPKLLAVSHLIKFPERYELDLMAVNNEPYLTVVDVGSQIDLALAARLAGITVDEIYQLNPGFSRWATAPEGPHQLALPIDKAPVFERELAALPASERVQWARHEVKSGESLGVIASRYNTTVAALKDTNELTGNLIRVGQQLLIPVAGESTSTSLSANIAAKGKKTTYTVQAGDSWWNIARSHNIEVDQLAKWNDKKPRDMLHPGQQLVIYASSNAPGDQPAGLRTVNYTIRDGDSLWKISRRFNVSVANVREWNNLTERSLLHPGQQLTLYVDPALQLSQI